MFDETMVNLLQKAFENAVIALKNEYDEEFYYLAYIFDEGMRPYISAWSYEAYEKSIKEKGIDNIDKKWWKWNYADSPYVTYGYEEFFGELISYLDQRAKKLSEEELYGIEWETRIDSMMEALTRIKEQDKVKKDYDEIIINVEVAPPDGNESERAKKLNVASELLDEYINECENNSNLFENNICIDWQEIWHPKCCKVILIKKLVDKKLAARIRKDFSSPLGLSEFIKSCNTVPFIIRHEFIYKPAIQLMLDNKEYEDFIKIELIE